MEMLNNVGYLRLQHHEVVPVGGSRGLLERKLWYALRGAPWDIPETTEVTHFHGITARGLTRIAETKVLFESDNTTECAGGIPAVFTSPNIDYCRNHYAVPFKFYSEAEAPSPHGPMHATP